MTDIVALQSKVIEVATSPINTFVTQVIEVHAPVISAAQGPQGVDGARMLSELVDIDLVDLKSGSMLVYDTDARQWVATTLLNQQIIDSGQF